MKLFGCLYLHQLFFGDDDLYHVSLHHPLYPCDNHKHDKKIWLSETVQVSAKGKKKNIQKQTHSVFNPLKLVALEDDVTIHLTLSFETKIDSILL
jgi:hypothetical protein